MKRLATTTWWQDAPHNKARSRAAVLSEHVEQAYEALHDHVLNHPVVGVEEITWRLMAQKGMTSTTRWQVWALSAPDAVLRRLHPSGGAGLLARWDHFGSAIAQN